MAHVAGPAVPVQLGMPVGGGGSCPRGPSVDDLLRGIQSRMTQQQPMPAMPMPSCMPFAPPPPAPSLFGGIKKWGVWILVLVLFGIAMAMYARHKKKLREQLITEPHAPFSCLPTRAPTGGYMSMPPAATHTFAPPAATHPATPAPAPHPNSAPVHQVPQPQPVHAQPVPVQPALQPALQPAPVQPAPVQAPLPVQAAPTVIDPHFTPL